MVERIEMGGRQRQPRFFNKKADPKRGPKLATMLFKR